MTRSKSALLLGATGLTGSHLLPLLLDSEYYDTVIIYTRTPTGISHPKLQEKLIDYDAWEQAITADDVFCCLGTTIKKAKTRKAFLKVDMEYPVKIARLQYAAHSKRFLVVSALGASSGSAIFYSRVKGQMEEELRRIGFPSLFIFRPSIITGHRKEKRSAERIGLLLFRFISPLLIGPLKKYQPVSALAIAKAMLHAAQTTVKGTSIVSPVDIQSFA